MTDNWIYVQEPDVKVGRLQIFNNWSPYLVADPDTSGRHGVLRQRGRRAVVAGDEEFAQFAIDELCSLGLVERADVLDHTVLHVPKAYPAYFGTYERFDVLIREYLDRFANLFLIGRNGMHRYNNQDHSMLTAMVAGREHRRRASRRRTTSGSVNVEQEYHETKQAERPDEVEASAGSLEPPQPDPPNGGLIPPRSGGPRGARVYRASPRSA
jgi:hypothetical protein